MCGIAGWLGEIADPEGHAMRVIKTLQHRGPDDHKHRSWADATLIHTRLSIIDLSSSGSQPIGNEDGSVWVVFNGEIYNHRELRRRLENRGHSFRGRSDAEVLPHLYEEEQWRFVTKLRGMYALAVFDARARTLVLARDRFGIKPLFYALGKNRVAFASEIRALLELPDIDTRPDHQAIYDCAALSYIPAPQTFYRGIRALQPGELLEAHSEGDGVSWKTRTYHHWAITVNNEIDLAEATDRSESLMMTAVGRQMESDVPLGALLSGGIDSSLVSAAAQAADSGVRTFNVRFSKKEFDETWAASAVARHIGSRHQTLDMVDNQGTWELVTGLLRHAGQPFADTSLFAANAVCRLARRYVKVALSGDGGDEAFGGYNHYWRLGAIASLQAFPDWLWRAAWRGAAIAIAPLAASRMVDIQPQRVWDMTSADDDTSVIQNLFCGVHENEHKRLCRDLDVLPLRRLFERQWEHNLPPETSQLERLSAHATEVNVRLQLANGFLFKVDTASMREGLEVRVPMLDEDLFNFGLSLPHGLKVRGRTGKVVLREVAKRMLPPEIAQKPKHGFAVPIDTWVDEEFKLRLAHTLLDRNSRLPEFFNPEVYRPMVEAFCQGRPYPGVSRNGLYRRAFMLLSVHLAL